MHTTPRCDGGSKRRIGFARFDTGKSEMKGFFMEHLIGVVLAAVTCVFFGILAGFDRERIFYPMMLPLSPRTMYCLPQWVVPHRR